MGFKQQEETDIPVNLTIGRHRSWGGEVRYTKQAARAGKEGNHRAPKSPEKE